MRKRVLLAESNEVTRGVAESALRKSGYEVIAVSSADKTSEVLSFTRPDLLVVSADINGADDKPLFMQLQSDASTGQLPLLILDSAEGREVSYPEEVIIKLPIDPREFIERVNIFLLPSSEAKPDKLNPLHSSEINDDFLDAALGLDQIDVTDSEVMDNTTVRPGKRPQSKKEDDMVGFSSLSGEATEDTDHSRIESLIIEQDTSQISHRKSPAQLPASVSGTGKLEISDDAYGLENPEVLKKAGNENPEDYNSFLDSLRDESSTQSSPSIPSKNDSGSLTIQDTSTFVDPIIKVPTVKTSSSKEKKKRSAADSGGVERFVDEFKKEIEQMRSSENQEFAEPVRGKKSSPEDSSLNWKDRIEALDEQQVGIFIRRFAAELAERVATKMVAKIDNQKLLEMLKRSIIHEAKNPSH